jgi:hypothetical protein
MQAPVRVPASSALLRSAPDSVIIRAFEREGGVPAIRFFAPYANSPADMDEGDFATFGQPIHGASRYAELVLKISDSQKQ